MPRPLAPRTLVLRSADGRDFLRLAALRRDEGYPSVEVRCDATARGFAGGTDAWIDGFELKAFTGALRELEQSRRGRVELRAMTPEQLRLVLRSTDSAGHLLVEFAISTNVLVGDRPETVSMHVSGGFELDPGTFGDVTAGFVQLARAVAA